MRRFHSRQLRLPLPRLLRSLDHPPAAPPLESDRQARIVRGSALWRRGKSDKEDDPDSSDKQDEWDEGDDWASDDPEASSTSSTWEGKATATSTSTSKYDDGQWHPSSISAWSEPTASAPSSAGLAAVLGAQTPFSVVPSATTTGPPGLPPTVLAASASASPHNKVSATIAIPLSILSVLGLGMILLCARGLFVARKRNKRKRADLEKGGEWAERLAARLESGGLAGATAETLDEKARDAARKGVSVTMRSVPSVASEKDLPVTPRPALGTAADESLRLPPPARGSLLGRFDSVRRTLFGRRGRYADEAPYSDYDEADMYAEDRLDKRGLSYSRDMHGSRSSSNGRRRPPFGRFDESEHFTRMPLPTHGARSRDRYDRQSRHSRDRYSDLEDACPVSRSSQPRLGRHDSGLSRLSSIREYFSASRRSDSGIGGVDMREPDVDDYYFSAAAQRHSYPSHGARAARAHDAGHMKRWRSDPPSREPASPLFDESSMYNPHGRVSRPGRPARASDSDFRRDEGQYGQYGQYGRSRPRGLEESRPTREWSDREYERASSRAGRAGEARRFALEREDSGRSDRWSDSEVGGERRGGRR